MLTAVRKLVDAAAKNVQITKPVVTLESAPASAKKRIGSVITRLLRVLAPGAANELITRKKQLGVVITFRAMAPRNDR